MDAHTVRTALGALQGNPDSNEAWDSLKGALSSTEGDLSPSEADELLRWAAARHRLRGDARVAYELLELSAGLGLTPEALAALRKEQVAILVSELLEGQKAFELSEKAVLEAPGDAELERLRDELFDRVHNWKANAEGYMVEADSAPDDAYQSAMLMRAAEAEVCFSEEPSLLRVEENLERAIRLDSANLLAARLLEAVYRKSARYDEVVRVLERISERSPDRGARLEAFVRLAHVFATKLSDPERAAAAYDRVLELDPTQSDATAYASDYYSNHERWDELVRVYERPLRGRQPDPSFLGEMLQVALLHWRKRNSPADAEPWFDLIRRTDPTHEIMLGFYREYKAGLSDEAGLVHILQAAQRALPPGDERSAALAEEIARLTLSQAGAHKAIEEFKAALRADPNNQGVRDELKKLYKQTQGHNALVELLRQELERTDADDYQKRLTILREIATVYREYIKSDTALVGVLNQIVQLDGKLDEHDVGEVRELVHLHEKLGRPRELLVSKKLLAEIVPDREEKKALYRSMGRAWLDQFSQVQHAIEAYAALHELDPLDTEAIERLDELYRKRRSWKELYELYREQLGRKEGLQRVPLLKELAQLSAERLGNIEEALELYGQILDLDPTRTDALQRMEKYAERSKNLRSLADVLERQARILPEDETRVPVLTKLGGVYEQLEEPELAVQTWQRVLAAQPGNVRAMRVLRDTFLKGNRFDELEQLFMSQGDAETLAEVLSTAADRATDPEVRLDLSNRAARVYEQSLGQSARAVRSYERILSIRPGDSFAIERLLSIYEQEEKWARIPPLLEALSDLRPEPEEKLEILMRLVRVLGGQLGDRKGAAQAARRAFEVLPTDPRALDLLDDACRTLGNWDEFVQAFSHRIATLSRATAPAAPAAVATSEVPPPEEPSRPSETGQKPAKKRRGKGKSKAKAEPTPSVPPADEVKPAEESKSVAPAPLDEASAQARRELVLRLARVQGEELGQVGGALDALRRLASDFPGDDELMTLFEGLLRRERRPNDERWLYAHRASVTSPAGPAYAAWAAFEESQGEIDKALELYEQASKDEENVPALEAVVRLALLQGQPERAAKALERLTECLEGERQAQKEAALASLYASALGRPVDALERAERARALGAERGQVILVLKRLVEEPVVRAEAARILSELYEAGGDARQEADAVRAMLSEAGPGTPERAEVYDRLISIYEHKLHEPSGALNVTLDALREMPEREALWDQATALSERAGRPTDLLDALREAVRRDLPTDVAIDLARRAAAVCEEVLQDPAGAVPFYEKILALLPEDDVAWPRLREILTAGERWNELEDLCVREAQRTPDPLRKIELRSEVALLAEDILGDAGRAVSYHKEILELDENYKPSLESLDRLLGRLGKKQELAALLERRISIADSSEEPALRVRAARLAVELHEPERAIEHVEQVLTVNPADYEARDVAETLLQIGKVKLRAASLLEATYEARDEVRDLVRVLGVRAEALRPASPSESTPEIEVERRDLLRRIATLRDDRLHDDAGSFDVFAELVPLDPEDFDLRSRLIDAGRRLGRSEQVVEVLGQAAEAASSAELKGQILTEAAHVQEQILADVPGAMQTYQRIVAIDGADTDLILSAYRAMEKHLVLDSRYEALAENLKAQVALESDSVVRAELYGRLAHLYAETLNEPQAATLAWEGRLEDMPDDPASLIALSELYDQAGRYEDLASILLRRREAALQDRERQALTARLAEVQEVKLGQLERAIESYQTLLDEAGPSPEVLSALARLFQKTARYGDLGDILSKQAEVLPDQTAQLAALYALGQLRSTELGDTSGAVDAHRQALVIDMNYGPSREALLALLDGPDEPTRLEVAEILQPIFEAEGNYEGQLRLAEVQASASDDPQYRAERLKRAFEICEDLLGDKERAFKLALSGLSSALESSELDSYLKTIDRLALVTDRRAEQAAALSQIVKDIFDGDLQLETYHRIGAIYRDDLGDLPRAIAAYQSALEANPDDPASLEALDHLFLELGKNEELVDILDRRRALALSDEEQKELLYRKARLLAGALNQPDKAIEAFESLVDIALEPEAVSALSSLYTSEERFDDLAALIERQVEQAGPQAAPHHVELARVLIDRKSDLDRGLDELDNALIKDPSQSSAIQLLEEMADRDIEPMYKARIGSILERVYLARTDYDKLLRALSLQLTASDAPTDRREFATRMAQIYEEQKEDYASALKMNAMVLALDPEDELTVSEMERLARVLGSPLELASLFRAQVVTTGVDGEASARLARRAGQIYLEQGDPAQAIPLFRQAFEVIPEDHELFIWLDRAYESAGTIEDRIALYRAALEQRYEPQERVGLFSRIADLAEKAGDEPQAIEALSEILALDEEHEPAFRALERLYRKRSEWQELVTLYERWLEAVPGPRSRAERLSLAHVLERELKDSERALDQLEVIVQEEPSEALALAEIEAFRARPELRARVVEILVPIYETTDNWQGLLRLLEDRLELAHDESDKASLYAEAALLTEQRAGDLGLSMDLFARALTLAPERDELREELERLAARTEDWAKLAETYRELLETRPDLDHRSDVVARLAFLLDKKLDDPRAALVLYLERLEADPTDFDSISVVIRLSTLLGDWVALEKGLSYKAEVTYEPAARRSILLELGELRHLSLEDSARAMEAYERALAEDERDAEILDRLIELYQGGEDPNRLVELYLLRADADGTEPDEAYSFLLSAADLFEQRLEERDRAIECLTRALVVRPLDPTATAELARLYEKEERFSDLLDLLKESVGAAETEEARAEIRHRIARVLIDKLSAPEEALETWAAILATNPADERAREGIFALAEGEEHFQVPAAEILVPALTAISAKADLVRALRYRLSAEEDSLTRLGTLGQIANLEVELGHLDAALLALLQGLRGEPSAFEVHDEARALSRKISKPELYAQALAEMIEEETDPSVQRVLCIRAAEVQKQDIGDVKAAAAAYELACERVGDDEELLVALDGLYLELKEPEQLVSVLERRLALAVDPGEQAKLLVRIGSLELSELKRPEAALAAVKRALEYDVTSEEAVGLLKELIDRDELFDEVFDVLEETYRTRRQGAALADLHRLRLGRAEDTAARIDGRRALAHVLEDECQDPRAAQDILAEGVLEDPTNLGLVDEVERLLPLTGAYQAGAEILVRASELKSAADSASELCLRAAEWFERGGDLERQLGALRSAAALAPESDEILARIEALEEQLGQEQALLGTLDKRAALALDDHERIEFLRKRAGLAEKLGQAKEAEVSLRAILELAYQDVGALSALTELRRAAGDHEEEFVLLLRRAEAEPDASMAWALRREAAELARDRLGKAEEAARLFEGLVEESSDDESVVDDLLKAYELAGEWDNWVSAVERRLDRTSDERRRAALRLELARVHLSRRNDPATAAELLESVLEFDQRFEGASAELVAIYEKAGEHERLSDLLAREVGRALEDGQTPEAASLGRRRAALVETELEDLPLARSIWREIKAIDPGPEVYSALVRLDLALGERESAAVELEEWAGSLSGREQAEKRRELAALYRELGQSDAMLRNLESALALDPSDRQLRAELKQSYDALDRVADVARMTAEEADLETKPADRVRLLREAAALLRQRTGDLAGAATMLERAVEHAGDDRALLLELCDLYTESGRGHDAVQVLTRIVDSYGGKRVKELADVHRRLAKALVALGEPARAIEELDKAFRIEPGNVGVLHQLGELAIQSGDAKKAQQMYRALLLQKLEAGSPITKAEVFVRLGQTHVMLGENPKAKQMFERALQADPNLELAKAELQKL